MWNQSFRVKFFRSRARQQAVVFANGENALAPAAANQIPNHRPTWQGEAPRPHPGKRPVIAVRGYCCPRNET